MFAQAQSDTKVGIGQVAKLIGVASHTVRYWEKEFDFYLNPNRTSGRQRRYDEEDIEKLRNVHHMLKEDGYSIAGARRALLQEQENPAPEDIFDGVPNGVVSRLTDIIRREVMQQLATAR